MPTRDEVVQMIDAARSRGERPDLRELDLEQVNLSCLNLRDVILAGRLNNLIGADLCGADLSGAEFGRYTFRGNPLAGIIPYGDELEPVPDEIADLNQAKYDSNTAFPEGFDRYEELTKVD